MLYEHDGHRFVAHQDANCHHIPISRRWPLSTIPCLFFFPIYRFLLIMSIEHGYGPVVNGTQIVLYEYRPDNAAGFLLVALFGAVTIAHILYSLISLRAWHFIPLS